MVESVLEGFVLFRTLNNHLSGGADGCLVQAFAEEVLREKIAEAERQRHVAEEESIRAIEQRQEAAKAVKMAQEERIQAEAERAAAEDESRRVKEVSQRH